MATDDVTKMTSPCPCGNGTITVTQTMPDHPWVRANQIHYSAELNCAHCTQHYAVTEEWQGRRPSLVAKADLASKAQADAAVQQARKVLEGKPQIMQLRATIAAEIDVLPSKAAKHRLLQTLGLSGGESYQSFIKGSCDGENCLKGRSAERIVKAAQKLNLTVADDLASQAQELERLQQKAWSVTVKAIPTKAHWMAA